MRAGGPAQGPTLSEVSDTPRWPRPMASWRRPVGEDGASFAVGGTGVLGQLVAAVDEHRAEDRYGPGFVPVAVGCSPWLNDPELVRALKHYRVSVITMKPQRVASPEMLDLNRNGEGIPKSWLSDLDLMGRPNADGAPPPNLGDPEPEDTEFDHAHGFDLGPVRVLGWKRSAHPISHAKMLALAWFGEWRDVSVGPYYEDWLGFIPTTLWSGSANFTRQSRSSLEWATLTRDHDLVGAGYRFLVDLRRMSEPLADLAMVDPTPELTDAHVPEPDWDDENLAWEGDEVDR